MNITGKRVLITGGLSGIGLALAQVLLAKGAKAAIGGRRPEVVAEAVRSPQTMSAEILGIAADVATVEGRDATLEQALASLGSLDILVNNAGIALVGAPFYATYATAKAGLAHFGEALRRELTGEGIHVLTVYPGGTRR